MEGRKPPPIASYTFPNNPDMRKGYLWGSPRAKAFWKSFGVFWLAFGTWSAINMYLTRDQKGLFGMDFSGKPEEIQRRLGIWRDQSDIRTNWHLPGLNPNFQENQLSTDVNMRFDDGVAFVSNTKDIYPAPNQI